MTEAAIRHAIASSVVGITRHVMLAQGCPDYEAYRLVSESRTYDLLSDPDTRLFLLTNDELSRLYDCEATGDFGIELSRHFAEG